MIFHRFVAPALLAAALLGSGCGKKDNDKAPAPEPGSGTAVPTLPTPASAGSSAALPTGDPIALAKLTAIILPSPPNGAPASGNWKDAMDNDGRRLVNFVHGNDYWYAVDFIDCRMPMVKEYAAKAPTDRGVFAYCFDAPTGKFKDYPMFAPKETQRVLKVGKLTVIASLAMAGQAKLKAANLDAFLGAMDLAAIAKL